MRQSSNLEWMNETSNDEWIQAVGMLSTLHPRLEIDTSDPLSMAKSIEIHVREAYDLLETAWVIICNASNGNWEQQNEEWNGAAKKFREQYFAHRRGEIK